MTTLKSRDSQSRANQVVELPRRLLRENAVYGRRGKLQISRTKFRQDFVLHSDDDPFIKGSDSVRRLMPIRLGERCIAYDEAEIDELIQALADQSRANNAGRART